MSIKIYGAYRLKRSSDYWPLTLDVQKIASLKLRTYLTELFLKMMDCVDECSEKYLKGIAEGQPEGSVRADIVDHTMKEMYKAATISPYRSTFNFDASVTFREYKGRIYLLPYTDIPGLFDFLAEDHRIEEYHYQNQTDRPENVTRAEWSRRAKVWNALTDLSRWDYFTLVDICSYSKWWLVNPYFDLLRTGAFGGWSKKASPVAGIVRDSLKR